MKTSRITKENNNGITLIALIVTIIVLLILAGISIASLNRENGILNQTNSGKEKTEKAEIIERAQIDILGFQAENNGRLSKNQLIEILKKYFDDVPAKLPADLSTLILTSKVEYGRHEIKVSDIWNGTTLDSETEEVDYSQLAVGDYVNYPVYYDNIEITTYIPKDEYNGWRILSIDATSETVRLVSAGIPLLFRHKNVGSKTKTSVRRLTAQFFSTPITPSTNFAFSNCSFKTSEKGTLITDIEDLKTLFTNELTEIYVEGETYTDDDNTYTYIKDNPKVQSLTKNDVDAVWGSTTSTTTSINTNDLLAIPRKDSPSEYVQTWLASTYSYSAGRLYYVNSNGIVSNNGFSNFGIRPVVTLKSKVKFKPAKDNINNTQTWNISMP